MEKEEEEEEEEEEAEEIEGVGGSRDLCNADAKSTPTGEKPVREIDCS